MIKKLVGLGLLVGLTGCAGLGAPASFIPGMIYGEVKVPAVDLEVSSESTASTRVGTAMCTSVLGLIATGDCSVDTARKNGGISRISSVQFDVKNILGIYAEYTTKVIGN